MNFTSLKIMAVIGTMILFFQNCQKMEFAEVDSDGANTPQDVEQILNDCKNAALENRMVISDQLIRFEDSHQETGRSEVCEFSKSENLDQKEGTMRARYEQYRSLNLPADAVICDIEMSTQLQKFRYDDVFILTFNDRILATNNKSSLIKSVQPEANLSLRGSVEVPLYKYNWLSLRDQPFENVEDDYCIGAAQNKANCSWPVSEKAGQIKFEFDPELLVNLGVKAKSQDSQFGFIVTGDNDPAKDCAHERLEFSMQIKYFLKR